MTAVATITEERQAAVEAAARALVGLKTRGVSNYINLPFSYPDGSFVTVRVDPASKGFRVSDAGFAFRALESVGMDNRFRSAASRVGETIGVERAGKVLFIEVPIHALERAISDVGLASWRVAQSVTERMKSVTETEMAATMVDHLTRVFGAGNVHQEVPLIGISQTSWRVDAVVEHEGGRTVFDVVLNKAPDVYRTIAIFDDLTSVDDPPRTTAAVESKAAMGRKYSLLALAGNVVEIAANDAAYRRAAA